MYQAAAAAVHHNSDENGQISLVMPACFSLRLSSDLLSNQVS